MTITGKKYVECTLLNSNGAAEAEDSSYDSDYEAEDSALEAIKHSDVSRTTSDTLAAEFAEYVTLSGSGGTTPTINNNPGYTARVEFALKLGYTERLVQAALQKLGPEPAQNELLAELIKLGANNSSKLTDASDDADFALDNESHFNCLLQQDNASHHGTSVTSCCGSSADSTSQLRPVVIDGSNVAMSHGNKEVFSCRGIKICVDWFRARGHREITVFVPKWRKEASRPDNPIVDQEILGELERDRLLVFTPSRLVGGKRMVCYDDRYILRLAAEIDGIVVSNDNYRDLAQESPEFRRVVEERILMYSFVNDRFMPPDDPLGRSGPTLDNFLKVGQKRAQNVLACPYAKKCTYGNKCKYRHPERGPHPHKSVTERLVEHAQRHLQARGPSLSVPLNAISANRQHASLGKTKSWAASGGHSPSTPAESPSFETTLKSRSVESVTDVVDSSTSLANASCARAMMTANQNLQAYPASHGWMGPRVQTSPNNPESEPVNMHRKLQRQLSLNPSCDPRLSQFGRYHEQQQKHQQLLPSSTSSTRSSQAIASSTHVMMPNRQLTRHASNDTSYPVSISWNQQQRHRQQHHQHVTRIASAPDSYRAWPPRAGNNSSIKNTNSLSNSAIMAAQRLGASDPQINLLATQPSGYHMSNWGAQQHQQQQDARRHLHYHLANVFPEEQVQAAMALHPHETDPQKICAAILTIFPKV